jgi:hypothetical protein
MACVHSTIAEAVAADLNTADLSQSFTATRVYAPELQLRATEDAVIVRVWADPVGRTSTFADRARFHREYPVFVGVAKKCDVSTTSTVDAYAELLEEIEDLFLGKTLASYPSAKCKAAEQVALYSWEHIREARQYLGVVKLTFVRIA